MPLCFHIPTNICNIKLKISFISYLSDPISLYNLKLSIHMIIMLLVIIFLLSQNNVNINIKLQISFISYLSDPISLYNLQLSIHLMVIILLTNVSWLQDNTSNYNNKLQILLSSIEKIQVVLAQSLIFKNIQPL